MTRLAGKLIIGFAMALISRAAIADDLYIKDYAFVLTPGALQEPDSGSRLVSPIPQRVPLIFWSKLAGDAGGIGRLRGGGFLLFNRWVVKCSSLSQEATEDEALSGEKNIDVSGHQDWRLAAEDLNKEVVTRGWFDWRTASQRDFLVGCSYEVHIEDELGTPLNCPQLHGPCVITFDVKRD